MGPNGAGKSTLLSVSRLFEYEKGTIKIEGKAVVDYKNDDLAKN